MSKDLKHTSNYIAIDLGASGGRVVLGRWDGSRFALEEMHRFLNEPVSAMGHLHWDVLRLWAEIKTGLSSYAGKYPKLRMAWASTPGASISACSTAQGCCSATRTTTADSRTDGVPEQVFEVVPREQIFAQTGIQFMQINTLYQLFSMVQNSTPNWTLRTRCC